MRALIDFHARYLRRKKAGGTVLQKSPECADRNSYFIGWRALDPYITLVRSLRASIRLPGFPDNSISPVINNDRRVAAVSVAATAVVRASACARVSLLAKANKLDRVT